MRYEGIHYWLNEEEGIELVICIRSMLSYPVHNHVSVFTIGMIMEGIVDVKVGDDLMRCGAGDIFVIPPYLPHSINAIQEYSMLNLCIRRETLKEGALSRIRENVINILAEANLGCRDLYEDKICRVLNEISLNMGIAHIFMTDMVSRVREQIEQFPEEKVCIDEMAESVFVSKYHFIRTFKKEVGLTPHQFQLQNRIRLAQRLLLQNNKITEVAFDTGFCDQSHFIKQFKKVVGLSPSQFILACNMLSTHRP